MLREAEARGAGAKLKAYVRLSGPGWLQSALTLGGGTLAGSLYLGVLSGYSLLWLQPVAMALGLVMMSAIGYVSLTIREHPFQAVNRHINPVLGWAWALAALAASMVWVMAQYSLASGVTQQILLPGVFGAEGPFGDFGGRVIISALIFATVLTVTWNYDRGGWGVRLYEWILKITVIVIVLCFAGVVVRLAISVQGLDWGALWRGFIPNPMAILAPAETFRPLLEAVAPEGREYWANLIVRNQRDVAITAAAATIGINATFLFAYSLRRHGWGKEFRGFVKFDLFTGMLIPFLLVTAFVVIAAANQFHTVPQPGLLEEGEGATERQRAQFETLLEGRVQYEREHTGAAETGGEALAEAIAALSPEEKHLAAMLVTRDAFDLAASLRPFTGDFFGGIIFSLGVVGMTLSSITLHMLISGMVICEFLGRPHSGWTLRLGSLAAATGILGPFLWGQASFWLVVPTSIFAFTLLPIAYLVFILMMNHRRLLGDEMPRGGRRMVWNLAMGFVFLLTAPASLFMVWDRGGWAGISAVVIFLLLALIVQLVRKPCGDAPGEE